MPVKYWSHAGLLLGYRCEARCASCYLCCSPGPSPVVEAETALRIWRELIDASPHGCRVHLTGGEPFLEFDRLLAIARGAAERGLGPLEKIETNAAWACDEPVIRERLGALDAAGMGKLAISADPFHQQFIPIERPRRLARIATEMLGPGRVQVRWRDWLESGCDTRDLPPGRRAALFLAHLRTGRERLGGRAAEVLAGQLPSKPPEEFADNRCNEALLRSRHVHVGPEGLLFGGTCAGIVLGDAARERIRAMWRRLEREYEDRPIVGTLATAGPTALMRRAQDFGFVPAAGYAAKCHLCWSVRTFLASKGLCADELGPRRLYTPDANVGREPGV